MFSSDAQARQFHDQPEGGSVGLIVRNQLNVSGGQEQNPAGRYGLEASASLGNWTQAANIQLSRLGGLDNQLYHSVNELYTQRELQGSFFRLSIDSSQLD